VNFTRSLTEDLKRRDFTINALAYNETAGLVDLFDGWKDLEQGMIRCVGDPRERFQEDALRMLRALRFSAQLGFTIEAGTMEAIHALAGLLTKISEERIQGELVKLLVSPHPQKVRELYQSGISTVLFPWLDAMMEMEQKTPYHRYSVGEHTIHALCNVPSNRILRLTMLFHDVGKPETLTIDPKGIYHFKGHPKVSETKTRTILRALKFDNHTIDKVCKLVLWHDHEPLLTPPSVRRAIHRIGEEQYPELFAVKRADTLAKSDYRKQEALDYIDAYEKLYQEILANKDCLSLQDLAVSGSDLIEVGMEPGKEIGEALHDLLEFVLANPQENHKGPLLEKLKAWRKNRNR
jgi:tRNA nucleotidyltransferase (CCA-adding enzyme)